MVIAQTVQIIITQNMVNQDMRLTITALSLYVASMLVYAFIIYLLCRHASK